MKIIDRKGILFILIAIFFPLKIVAYSNSDTLKGLNKVQLQNIMLYAKIYGGIRHFYPSKAGQKIEWNKFAVYGVDMIIHSENAKELIKQLQLLFYPICNQIQFSINQPIFNQLVLPENRNCFYYKHHGIGNSMIRIPFVYNPYHVDVQRMKKTDTLFYYTDSVIYSNDETIYFSIPTSCSKGKISSEFKELQKKVQNINTKQYDKKNKTIFFNVAKQSHRIANFIIPWNEVRFFFPYLHLLDIDWDQRLENALRNVCKTQDTVSLFYEMHYLFNVLQDAHLTIPYDAIKSVGFLVAQTSIEPYSLPVEIYYKNDTVVVVSVAMYLKDSLPVGSIIDSINGINIKDFVANRNRLMSGSEHWKNSMLSIELLKQYENPNFKLQITTKEGQKKQIELLGNHIDYYPKDTNPVIYEIEDNIYCLNFSSYEATPKTIRKGLKSLQKQNNVNGIVVDMRKQWFNHRFLSYFTDTVLYSAYIHYPQKRTPHKIEGYKSEHFKVRPNRKIFSQPVVFLTSSRIMSYGESILGIVDYYQLGEIIGEPTAGCNGDIAGLSEETIIDIHLITGAYVEKHDGTQLYNVGIIPTVKIENSAIDVIRNIDRQMQVAIDRIKKQKEK